MKSDIIKLFIILSVSTCLFLLLTRCEKDPVDYNNFDCSDCYEIEPDYSYLKIVFSEDICDTVDIIVYRGYANESMIEWQGFVVHSPFYLDLTPVNNLYSVKATYATDTATIAVVDAEKLETNLVTGMCDTDCYVITGGEYDVEFK